jgi:hypothetical protein
VAGLSVAADRGERQQGILELSKAIKLEKKKIIVRTPSYNRCARPRSQLPWGIGTYAATWHFHLIAVPGTVYASEMT